ncbi:MAG: UDP-N-acetyl glucosamine 2-epimerase [Planctomycetia bacterium]
MAGTRPNLVKLAPLVAAAAAAGRVLRWVHTGQHVDPAMARALWRELGLPAPAAVLEHVPPGPRRAERMAAALVPVLAALEPALVVVVGDVDSTVAGALAARRLQLPLAHVEAGLRSGERGLPEERNRRRVDRLAGLLHASEPSAVAHLRREGAAAARIPLAGNVVADALAAVRRTLPARPRGVGGPLVPGGYGVVTLHRAAAVDTPARLARTVAVLCRLARDLPWVFPVHPRTARALGAPARRALARAGVRQVAPLGHRDFLALLRDAAVVVTDSGGVPVEASLLGVPCVTLRARYEHRLTLTHGTNRLCGADARRLPAAVARALARPAGGARRPRPRPDAWDGRAAGRIVAHWLRAGM